MIQGPLELLPTKADHGNPVRIGPKREGSFPDTAILQGSRNYMGQNEPELHGFRKVVVSLGGK